MGLQILGVKVSRMVLPDCLEAVWHNHYESRFTQESRFLRIPAPSGRGVVNLTVFIHLDRLHCALLTALLPILAVARRNRWRRDRLICPLRCDSRKLCHTPKFGDSVFFEGRASKRVWNSPNPHKLAKRKRKML
jgi:hypothetical protein